MRLRRASRLPALALILLSTLLHPLSNFAQSTAFTYQGFLTENGGPVNGPAEIQFTLWDAANAGTQIAATAPATTVVGVTNGLFTTALDFGAGAFNGLSRFIQMEVRTGLTPFTPVSPRQPVTATPYAIRALNVASNGLSGGIYSSAVNFNNAGNTFAGAFTGTMTGNGAGLSNVNAATIGGLVASNLWRIGGNAGANPTNGRFLGTTDNLPLEFRVFGQRVLWMKYAATIGAVSPNIVGGSPANDVTTNVTRDVVGAFIGGGGYQQEPNLVENNFAAVIAGFGNTASGYASMAMGLNATASGECSTALGSWVDAIGRSSVAMGSGSTASGDYSCAVGRSAAASGNSSMALGRDVNAYGDHSFAMGRLAKAVHTGSFVWADSQTNAFNSTAVDQFAIRAGGGMRVEGGTDAKPDEGGFLTLGDTDGLNLVLDNNEIMARNNGVVATLALNFDGGDVRTGGALGVARAPAGNSLEVEGSASKTVSGSWFANSDARIKQEVQPVTSALDTLGKVRLVSFRYTDDYLAEHRTIEDRRYLNVIAQEFSQVFPEHVKSSGEKLPDGSDILQVDIHPLTIYSAAAIQELNRKLEQKETEITELQTRLAKLEQLMNHKLNGGAQ